MKKLLLINVLLFQVVFLFGQGSLQIFDHDGGQIINGQTIEVLVDLDAWESVSPELFVLLTSETRKKK